MIGYDLTGIIIRFIEGDGTISLSKIQAQQEQAAYTGFDFRFGHLQRKQSLDCSIKWMVSHFSKAHVKRNSPTDE